MPSAEAIELANRYGEFVVGEPAKVASDLDSYVALLRRWQRAKNLVSRETLHDVWSRHIADSLQMLECLTPGDHVFLDLGSGAGLPAIPLAIVRHRDSLSRFVLVESNGRKASFLKTVARDLALPLEIYNRRAQEIDSRETLRPDVISSRALAPLPDLFRLAFPFFGPPTRAIFHKGRDYREEVAESRSTWDFDLVIVPSDTCVGSALLEIRNLRYKSSG